MFKLSGRFSDKVRGVVSGEVVFVEKDEDLIPDELKGLYLYIREITLINN